MWSELLPKRGILGGILFYVCSFTQHSVWEVYPWCYMYRYFWGWLVHHVIGPSHLQFLHMSCQYPSPSCVFDQHPIICLMKGTWWRTQITLDWVHTTSQRCEISLPDGIALLNGSSLSMPTTKTQGNRKLKRMGRVMLSISFLDILKSCQCAPHFFKCLGSCLRN